MRVEIRTHPRRAALLRSEANWMGGIHQFLVDEQCDPEIIERVMADEMKRVL